MKVYFFGDSPVTVKDGSVYTLTSFFMSNWKKYTDYFGEIHAVLRQRDSKKELNDEQKIVFPVNVITFPSIALPTERVRNLSVARKIVKEAIKDCDAAIIKVPTFIGAEAIKLAEKYNKPYFIEVGECIFDSLIAEKNVFKIIAAPILYVWHRHLIRHTKYGIYVTKAYLQRRYPLVKGGIYASCSNVTIPSVQESVLEKRLSKIKNMNKGTIELATVGNMTNKLKALDVALVALKHQCLSDTDVVLHIYGDYSLELWQSYLDELPSNVKVIFEGFVSNKEELFSRLDNTDIYIHPSRAEGLPRAVIEATMITTMSIILVLI